MIVMHLFHTDDPEEKALCGTEVSVHELISVEYYLEGRKDGIQIGTVCEGCKALTVPFVVTL